jgi:hypothetical protein
MSLKLRGRDFEKKERAADSKKTLIPILAHILDQISNDFRTLFGLKRLILKEY